jgi:GT2 family glycosyltransferase
MLNLEISIVIYRTKINKIEKNLSYLRKGISASLNYFINIFDNGQDEELRDYCYEQGFNYYSTGKNIGFGAGHNWVFSKRKAFGDFFLILNPDIYIDGDNIFEILSFLNRNENVGILSPRLCYPDGSEQKITRLFPTPISMFTRKFLNDFSDDINNLETSEVIAVPFIHGACLFARTDILESIGFFDERFFLYCEDMDLCRKISHSHLVVYYGKISAIHEYAKGSSKSVKLLYYHICSTVKYFLKWGLTSGNRGFEINTVRKIHFK